MVICRRSLWRGAACAPGHAGGGDAVPRRGAGGVRLGRPRDCRAVPKGSARRLTRKPEDIRPPATTSRARPKGAKGTPKVIPKGVTQQRIHEEWLSGLLEA